MVTLNILVNKLLDHFIDFFSHFQKENPGILQESGEETDESFRFVCAESLVAVTVVGKSFIVHLWNNGRMF